MTVETSTTETVEERLLRIQAVADQVGLTTRSIRYYEEIGLMKPAARSDGDYRLYDADDVARLQFIKALRDETGFSLAEIGQLLEDENARQSIGARFRASTDPRERRALLHDGIARIDRQVATLKAKIERIDEMIASAEARRGHLKDHLAELEPGATVKAHPERATPGRTTTERTTTERTR
jgi:MerR family transcriptional regulator, repressor of the yfmOP operon